METFLQIYLILTLTTLTYSASISPQTPSRQVLQIVQKAVQTYNEDQEGTSPIYKLLQQDYKESKGDFSITEVTTFIIRETLCRKPAENLQDCPYKEDGVMKNCTVTLSGSAEGSGAVTCHTMDMEDNRSQSRLKEENQKERIARRRRKVKLFSSAKKPINTNFLDIGNTSSLTNHAVASCLQCILDLLNPNTKGTK